MTMVWDSSLTVIGWAFPWSIRQGMGVIDFIDQCKKHRQERNLLKRNNRAWTSFLQSDKEMQNGDTVCFPNVNECF